VPFGGLRKNLLPRLVLIVVSYKRLCRITCRIPAHKYCCVFHFFLLRMRLLFRFPFPRVPFFIRLALRWRWPFLPFFFPFLNVLLILRRACLVQRGLSFRQLPATHKPTISIMHLPKLFIFFSPFSCWIDQPEGALNPFALVVIWFAINLHPSFGCFDHANLIFTTINNTLWWGWLVESHQ